MRPIRLPEPEPPGGATPEIFAAGGGAAVVRRAVVIGNGCAGAEGQCLGLLRALGLADRLTLYRAIRPTGGINKWLHFLPISFHKILDQFLRRVFSDMRFATLVQGNKFVQYPVHNCQSFGLSYVLEADAQKMVTMVRDTFEKFCNIISPLLHQILIHFQRRSCISCCLWPRYHIVCKFHKVFSSR